MKIRLTIGVLAAAGLVLAGCGKSGEGTGTTGGTSGSASNGGKKYQIFVIPKGSTHEYWKAVHAGADDAAAELGANVVFQGPLKENDRESQVSLVENAISGGTDALVLAPLDSQGLVKPVKEALDKNIPVVIIDSALNSDGYASFVATDNEKGGQMDGDEMIKLLNGKGNIVVLRYAMNSASTEAREKGFEEEIRAKAPGIKILTDKLEAGPTVDTAVTNSENLLAPYKRPDGSLNLDGIFCPNESSTEGMLKVLEQNKWAGTVKFVGFDANSRLIDGLKDGHLNAIVVQNPYQIGYQGVKAAVLTLEKKPVDKRIDTGATLITKDNMNLPEQAKLLAPKQA